MAWNWSIIKPKAATNYLTNPSFEPLTTGIPTGWTASNTPTFSRVSTYTWAGLFACQITKGSGTAGYYQNVAGTNGQSYTGSVYVYIESGSATLRLTDYNATTNPVTSTSSTVGWTRLTATKVAAGGGVRVQVEVTSGTSDFDAAQLEDGTSATTYIDGYRPGCYWTGLPDVSTSVRDGQSREGGEIINLSTYCTKVLAFPGAGMPPFKNVDLPFGLVGGSVYQRTIKQARPFVIRVLFDTQTNYFYNRRMVEDLIKFDAVTPTQPVMMRFDDGGLPGLLIKAVYSGGMEIVDFDGRYETVDIAFTAHDPLFYSEQEKSQALNFSQTIANANSILMRDVAGTWKAMGSGANANTVYKVVTLPDGSIVVCGDFGSMGGVANTAYLARWTGAGWASMGVVDNLIYDMVVSADGTLWVVGGFANIGGVAASCIAKYSAGSWSAVTAGSSGVSWFNCIAIGTDNSIYVGGHFTSVFGVAANAIAKYSSSTWSALGAGLTGAPDLHDVMSILVDKNGDVYAAGTFTTAGAVTTKGIAKYSASAWAGLGGVGAAGYGALTEVSSLAQGPDNTIYMAGVFTSINGISANGIARWNGTAISPLGTGPSTGGSHLVFGPDGFLYVGGSGLSLWNGYTWMQSDVTLPGSPTVYAICFDRVGNLYLGFSTQGSATSGVVTAATNSSTNTFPRFIICGPGTFWQLINYTTGKRILFNGLTLSAGEVGILQLQQGNISFTSNWTKRPDLLGYILSGSNVSEFYLKSGANNISALISSGTGNSSISMLWRDAYWSVDGVD